jgi:hypothetical protein
MNINLPFRELCFASFTGMKIDASDFGVNIGDA